MPGSDECVAFVIQRGRQRSFVIRMLPTTYVELVARHLYWLLRTKRAQPHRAQLIRTGVAWVRRQQAFPWWVVLLLRVALPLIVALLLEWMRSNEQ